jgi:hypothetical protein
MIRKFKNIAPLLLLLVFLLPSIVKFEHRHKNHFFKVKAEKQYNIYNEKCSICSFEFSVFSSNLLNIKLEKEKHLANYSNNYSFQFNSTHSDYSFLLRGPPVFTNII